MADFTTTDYFSDESVAADTYPYFDFLLEGRRVWREPYHGVVMVAGHEEVLAVMRDTASFSNCNIVAGPNFTFPVELTGDDVTDVVERTATNCRWATRSSPSTRPSTRRTARC